MEDVEVNIDDVCTGGAPLSQSFSIIDAVDGQIWQVSSLLMVSKSAEP